MRMARRSDRRECDRIAGLMAETVIDRLEVIDVQQRNAEGLARALRPGSFLGEQLQERAAIERTGQLIVASELLNPFERSGELLVSLGQLCSQRTELRTDGGQLPGAQEEEQPQDGDRCVRGAEVPETLAR